MKRLAFLVVLLFTYPVIGQDVKPIANASASLYLHTFLSVDDSYDLSSIESFDSFINKLEKKKASIKKEKDFVRYVFSKTHQLYLKKFVPYAMVDDIFHRGSYNCLTGTILYATILSHFQIPFEVTETNYHIFLTVETAQGKILLEATDPIDGFVDRISDIEKRIASYKRNEIATSSETSSYYRFSFNLYKQVSMDEMRGLLYYNKAVNAFNNQKLGDAIQFLVKSNELYYSSRIEEFSAILMIAIQQSNLTQEEKEKSLKVVYPISQRSSLTVASLSSY